MKQYLLILLLSITSFSIFSQPCNVPPAGLDCDSAPVLCDLGELNGYCTLTPDFPSPTGPSPLCLGQGVPNNTIFLGFVAESAFIDLTIWAENCTSVGGQLGIQGGIYSGDCSSLTPIVCQGICQLSAINLSSGQFIPGQKYWILIDGCNGSSCDITIEVNAGEGSSQLGTLSNISGPTKICSSNSFEYSVNPVNNANFYYWTLNGAVIGNPEFEDEKISLNFDSAGVYQLCVDVANYCTDVTAAPSGKCIDIFVTGSTIKSLPPVQICARDTYYYEGKAYPVGIHNIKYTGVNGCDSTILLQVDSFPIPVTKLGFKYICKGDCYSIKDSFGNGKDLCESSINNNVYLQSWQGCDSIVNVSIRRIDLNADIKKQDLTCIDTTVMLLSNFNPTYVDSFKIEWTTVNGNILSPVKDKNIEVNAPGEYCLNMTIYGKMGIKCYDTLCTTVVNDTIAPSVDFKYSGDSILRCGNNPITLVALTNESFFEAHWNYNGQLLISDSIEILKAGTISLVIYDINGCSSDTLLIDTKSTYKFKDTLLIDTLLCYGQGILIDSIVYLAPNNINHFTELNDTCYYTHFNLGLKNLVDTILYNCDNESLELFGIIIPKDSINYYVSIPNTTGCDSVWHVKVNKLKSNMLNFNAIISKGSIYHGILITKDTVIIEKYINLEGCDSIVTIHVMVPVSTNNINKELEIIVVPNPAKDQITLYSEFKGYTKSIDIHNSLGQKLISKEQVIFPYNIDIASLAGGMYWIRVHTDEGVSIISFIKSE